MEHIISVTVENKFGSLSRVAGLFSGRGFNIESLSVAPTLDPSMSQMTIVTSGDERIIEQIVKQLNKLIDVIKVVDLNESDFVSRETALIKVHTTAGRSRRSVADRRYFPGQRHRFHPGDVHDRGDRRSTKNRSDHQPAAAPRNQRTHTYRTGCGCPRVDSVDGRAGEKGCPRIGSTADSSSTSVS